MFLTYTVTWLTFFLYPAIGIQAPEAYVATTLVFMLNCGINSIIYLALNKEVAAFVPSHKTSLSSPRIPFNV